MTNGPEQVKGLQAQRYQIALGQRLRVARVDAKRSLTDVALYLGVSKQLIHALESGRSRASAWQVFQVAEFTGADYYWLLSGRKADSVQSPLEQWIEAGDRRAPQLPKVQEERLFL